MTAPNRILAIGLLSALIISVAVFARPGRSDQADLVVLASQVDPKDAVQIKAKLAEAGIPAEQAGDGFTFKVKQTDLFAARLALAEAGLPRGGPAGYDLLDQSQLGTTEAERKVNYKRAMEGELARAIPRLQPVDTATVFLDLPQESLFVERRQPAKASVLLSVRPGQELEPDQVKAIMYFVAGAIKDLDPKDVVVVDTAGRILSADVASGNGSPAVTGDQLRAKMLVQQDLEKRLRAVLEPAYGPGNITVMVTADLDFDSKRIDQVTVETPPTSPDGQGLIISSERSKEEFSGTTGAGAGGVSGTDANGGIPGYDQAAAGGGSSESSKLHETINREVNKTQTTTVTAPGTVKNLSVGVMVNQNGLAKGADPKQTEANVEKLVKAITAADVKVTDSNGGQLEPKVMVSVVPFSTAAADALKEFAKAGQNATVAKTFLETWSTALATAVGLLALLFVFLALRRRQSEPTLAGVPGSVMDLSTADLERAASIPAGPATVVDPQKRQFTLEELLDPDFVVKMNSNPERQAVREQVRKVTETNPEMVAGLLRAWINED